MGEEDRLAREIEDLRVRVEALTDRLEQLEQARERQQRTLDELNAILA